MENITEFLKGQLPAITEFGIKVVLAILAFYIGGKLIQWLLRFIRKSMERANMDTLR